MTPSEFTAALVQMGVTQRGFAKAAQSDERTVRRWAAGERQVPGPIQALIFAIGRDPGLLNALTARHAAHQEVFTVQHDGEDWGRWPGETAEAALLACLADSDRTRQWDVQHLSDSADYGRSDGRAWGNGAMDRSRFWFVSGDRGIGVFAVADTQAGA